MRQQGAQRFAQLGVSQIDLAHEIQRRRHVELAGEALAAFGEPLGDRAPVRVRLAYRPDKIWRQIGQPAERVPPVLSSPASKQTDGLHRRATSAAKRPSSASSRNGWISSLFSNMISLTELNQPSES